MRKALTRGYNTDSELDSAIESFVDKITEEVSDNVFDFMDDVQKFASKSKSEFAIELSVMFETAESDEDFKEIEKLFEVDSNVSEFVEFYTSENEIPEDCWEEAMSDDYDYDRDYDMERESCFN